MLARVERGLTADAMEKGQNLLHAEPGSKIPPAVQDRKERKKEKEVKKDICYVSPSLVVRDDCIPVLAQQQLALLGQPK